MKTVLKALGQCSFASNSEPSSVDADNGRIIRIRLFHYDEKQTKNDLLRWRIEKDGKTFKPSMKSALPAYQLAYKKRVYSPNRIKYPLKRVDWDPEGERNILRHLKESITRLPDSILTPGLRETNKCQPCVLINYKSCNETTLIRKVGFLITKLIVANPIHICYTFYLNRVKWEV